jgi:hypothetical protein
LLEAFYGWHHPDENISSYAKNILEEVQKNIPPLSRSAWILKILTTYQKEKKLPEDCPADLRECFGKIKI